MALKFVYSNWSTCRETEKESGFNSFPTIERHHYYRPQRSCEGYVFTRVCHSVQGGGCLPQCMLVYCHHHRPPPPPYPRLLLRTVRILLECILVHKNTTQAFHDFFTSDTMISKISYTFIRLDVPRAIHRAQHKTRNWGKMLGGHPLPSP